EPRRRRLREDRARVILETRDGRSPGNLDPELVAPEGDVITVESRLAHARARIREHAHSLGPGLEGQVAVGAHHDVGGAVEAGLEAAVRAAGGRDRDPTVGLPRRA